MKGKPSRCKYSCISSIFVRIVPFILLASNSNGFSCNFEITSIREFFNDAKLQKLTRACYFQIALEIMLSPILIWKCGQSPGVTDSISIHE